MKINREQLLLELKKREIIAVGTSMHSYIRGMRRWLEAAMALEAAGKVTEAAMQCFDEITNDAIDEIIAAFTGFQDTLSDLTFATGEIATEYGKLRRYAT